MVVHGKQDETVTSALLRYNILSRKSALMAEMNNIDLHLEKLVASDGVNEGHNKIGMRAQEETSATTSSVSSHLENNIQDPNRI